MPGTTGRSSVLTRRPSSLMREEEVPRNPDAGGTGPAKCDPKEKPGQRYPLQAGGAPAWVMPAHRSRPFGSA